MQRHLATLEALDAHARARGLALAAAATRLARARADAAADALPALARARPVGEFVELHRSLLEFFFLRHPGLSRYPRLSASHQDVDGRHKPGHDGQDSYFASTTRTRCPTLAIMPRTDGVSSSSEVRPILLSRRPINVSRCVWCRRAGLPVCSILMVFAFFAMAALAGFQLSIQSAAASASAPSRRRACRAETLMLRRAATERGESWCLSASNVARTML